MHASNGDRVARLAPAGAQLCTSTQGLVVHVASNDEHDDSDGGWRWVFNCCGRMHWRNSVQDETEVGRVQALLQDAHELDVGVGEAGKLLELGCCSILRPVIIPVAGNVYLACRAPTHRPCSTCASCKNSNGHGHPNATSA